jgi:hypothetical protein
MLIPDLFIVVHSIGAIDLMACHQYKRRASRGPKLGSHLI